MGGRAGLSQATILVVCFLLISPTIYAAADAVPGGVPLVSDPIAAFRASSDRSTSAIVGVRGPAFDQAIRVTVDGTGNAWDVELRASITRPVAAGSLGWMRFWARNADPSRGSQAVFTVSAQKASPGWDKSLMVDVAVGEAWQEFNLPWRWVSGYGTAQSMIAFGLGRLPQAVEIGGLEVLEYTGLALEDLPRTAFTYVGREASAAWRAAAEARIEQVRKAPLTIRVVDRGGRPVRGADVQVEMTRHAFPFGSAVVASRLVGEGEQHAIYRDHVERLFNSATLENDLKWPSWEGRSTRVTS